jgi:hypothetical protein
LLGTYTLLGTVVGAVGKGSMVKAVSDIYIARQPNFLACLKVGLKKAPTLMMTGFLYLLGFMIGTLAGIAPGVYLIIAWFLYSPAVVLEHLGPFASLQRSHNLLSDAASWCYVFCAYLIVLIIASFIQKLWSSILFFLGDSDAGHHALFSATGSIVASIPNLFMVPLVDIIQSVMYFNLRVEKEGLNAVVLLREVEGAASSDESTSYGQVSFVDEENTKTTDMSVPFLDKENPKTTDLSQSNSVV